MSRLKNASRLKKPIGAEESASNLIEKYSKLIKICTNADKEMKVASVPKFSSSFAQDGVTFITRHIFLI